MSLKLYNTLTRKKEKFIPIRKNEVGIYGCGPTVYNYVHIGNLRAYVVYDILRRYLEFSGYKVKEIMNITDVDDKTIRDSKKENKSLKEFTKKYTNVFIEDIKAINIEMPAEMPNATEHIKEMVDIVQVLLDKEYAYKTEDGIYFSIRKFKNYGNLSGINLDDLEEGASERVLKDEYDKENPRDFVLWKFWDKDDGEVFWKTKIGKGRPGWHIECSAMSKKYLGETFDIHAGGQDLIFPHHENEIALSESSNGKKFVNYWIHNGWVLADGKKMSKSLGNFYNLKDILEKNYSALDLRYFYLTKNYRQNFNFTWKNLESSKNSLQRLKNIISEIKDDKKSNKKYIEDFRKVMEDDLNTPEALQVLWKLIRDENAEGKLKTIKEIDKVFGLDLLEKDEVKIPKIILEMAKERENAREKKDWKKSDELRGKINKMGYNINDTKEGSKITKK